MLCNRGPARPLNLGWVDTLRVLVRRSIATEVISGDTQVERLALKADC